MFDEFKLKYTHSKPTINQADLDAVEMVLKSGHLEDGESVREFEKEVANYLNRKYAIATVNGFSAIHLSLLALGVTKENEVIIPSYSCPALLYPILHLKAKPIILDIEKNGFNISVNAIDKAISDKTKAIIVPHMFGFPAQIDTLKKYNVPVIEDCAQSIGGYFKNHRLGQFGDISVLSFYATKIITAGDAGMIITDNKKYSEIINDYIYYGHKDMHNTTAFNYHLTNLPAALGLSQFKQIDKFILKRKLLAKTYDDIFRDEKRLSVSFVNKQDSIFFRYPVLIDNAIAIKQKLLRKGIGTGRGVLNGLHELYITNSGDFSNTNHYLKKILSLPIYPSLENQDIEYIAKTVIEEIIKK